MLLPRISCSLHMFTLQQGYPIFFSRESHDNECVCARRKNLLQITKVGTAIRLLQ
jgi:hypothetical protein